MTAREAALPPSYRLYHTARLESTNDEAKALARKEGAGPSVVWADEQTKGRGRRGRPWISPPGNLYVSLLLYPHSSPAKAAQLGFLAALALVEALAFEPESAVSCKWPNDVLLRGRKVAGILIESEMGEEKTLAYLVLGLGVNLVSFPAGTDFPATSLLAEGGGNASPAVILERFLPRFDGGLRLWQEEGFAPFRASWLRRAAFLGEPIRVRLANESLEGRFVDMDEEGSLILRSRGQTRRISAGEVFPAAF